MNLFDLFEGAIDDLEARRIEDLEAKMDDFMARAKESNNPKYKEAMRHAYAKAKAERDSYYKLNVEEETDTNYTYTVFIDGTKEGTYGSKEEAKAVVKRKKEQAPGREYTIRPKSRTSMASIKKFQRNRDRNIDEDDLITAEGFALDSPVNQPPMDPANKWKIMVRQLIADYIKNPRGLYHIAKQKGPNSAEAFAYNQIMHPTGKIALPPGAVTFEDQKVIEAGQEASTAQIVKKILDPVAGALGSTAGGSKSIYNPLAYEDLDEEGKGTPVPAKAFAQGVLKDLKKVNVKKEEQELEEIDRRGFLKGLGAAAVAGAAGGAIGKDNTYDRLDSSDEYTYIWWYCQSLQNWLTPEQQAELEKFKAPSISSDDRIREKAYRDSAMWVTRAKDEQSIVKRANAAFNKLRSVKQGVAEGKWSNVIHTTDRSDEKAQREQEHKKQAGLAATVLKNHSQALDPKEIDLLTRYNLHHRGKPGVRFDRLDNEKAQQLIQNVLRFNQKGVAEAADRVDPILIKALNRMPDGLATHGEVLDACYDAYAMELGRMEMKSNYGTTHAYIPQLMDLYKQKHGLTFNEEYTPAPVKPPRSPQGFNKQGTGLGNKLADLNRKEWEEKKKKEQGVTEDTGSWIVYDPASKQIKKRFKTHTAGKSYAKVHGLGFASSEYYFDRVKDQQSMAEDEQIDGMARGEVKEIIRNASTIQQALDQGVSLDGWMYSYVTTSNDHLNSVAEQIGNPDIEEAGMGWAAHKSTGPKFSGYLKGTDPAPTEFSNKSVGGMEEGIEGNMTVRSNPLSQPLRKRNYVAKNAQSSGAGKHNNNLKAAAARGQVKHKAKAFELDEMTDDEGAKLRKDAEAYSIKQMTAPKKVEPKKSFMQKVGDKQIGMVKGAWKGLTGQLKEDDQVLQLQKQLIAKGAKINADGIMGPQTQAAIKQFGTNTAPAQTQPTNATTSGTDKEIQSVVKAGQGFNIIKTSDGETQRRTGARNWRNNNPGNIQYSPYAKSKGAIGTDGRYAIFPTLDAGMAAKKDLLFGSAYNNLSIAQAISKYAPPHENNTEGYIQAIVAATKATPDTIMSQLNDNQKQQLLNAVTKQEGFKVGSIQVIPDANVGVTESSDNFLTWAVRNGYNFTKDPAIYESARKKYKALVESKKKTLSEAKGLGKKVRVVSGSASGQTGTIGEIRNGAFKGAPKYYTIDLDNGGHVQVRKEALRLIQNELAESLKKGEYFIWTVYFDDGSSKRIKVTSDEFDPYAYYAKKNQVVVNVNYDWSIHQ